MPAMDEFGLRYGKSRRKGRWDKDEAEEEELEREEMKKYKKEKAEKAEEEKKVRKECEALELVLSQMP